MGLNTVGVFYAWRVFVVCNQCEKGKFHGSVDIGLSVIACKKKGRRIDVDADDLIYHLKVSVILCKYSVQIYEW